VTVRACVAAAGLLLAGGLTGCGGSPSPEAQLRDAVAAATSAANERDADSVRAGARRIVDLARAERAELGADRADRLTALASALDEAADQIDPAFLEAQRRAREDAERAAAERAAREQAAREQAARDQAARQQAARQQAARAQAARDQAARERAVTDRGSDEDEDKGRGKGKDNKDDD
jgi:hypothetical protein